jgi:glycerol-3-phosphate dehydrogenase (NAD(P)+)
LSGPSFAAEVADEQPTAVTIASHDESVSKSVQEIMSTVRFRCYTTTDVVGVEFGGALKNVLAIACGISDGLGFGCNARAALMTRGMTD